ncbi:hypothetical protein V6N13_120868 [Hibiscus sabdariffa]
MMNNPTQLHLAAPQHSNRDQNQAHLRQPVFSLNQPLGSSCQQPQRLAAPLLQELSFNKESIARRASSCNCRVRSRIASVSILSGSNTLVCWCSHKDQIIDPSSSDSLQNT